MKILKLRRKIDEIDREMVRLLGQRARYSLEIGRMKQAGGMRLFHRKREQGIAHNVARANRGPLPDRAVQHLWEQILQHTRAAVRIHLRKERKNIHRRVRRGRGGEKSVSPRARRSLR